MKKLTLDLEELTVDSFEIAPSEQEKGTVRGNWAWSDESVCPTVTDRGPRCPY